MFESTDVISVFNSDICKKWSKKGKKANVVIGDDNPMKQEILKYLKDGLNILEIGCGDGSLLAYMNEKVSNCNIMGVDASEAMIKQANERFKNTGKKNMISFKVGLLEDYKFEKEFDLIIMKQVLHHLSSPDAALKKIGGFMKSDAILIMMVPGEHYQENLISYKCDDDILGRYSSEKIEKLIVNSGMFALNISNYRFAFEFENIRDYLLFMINIGSFQKMFDYRSDEYGLVRKWLEIYDKLFNNTDRVSVMGEYILVTCILGNDNLVCWSE